MGLELGFGEAAVLPEGVERLVVVGAAGVGGETVDGAECGELDAGGGAGAAFAFGEEADSDATAAPCGVEDGFAEVEDGFRGDAGVAEGRLDGIGFADEGDGGADADDGGGGSGDDEDGVGSGGVGAEVFGFVFHGAFVEIGPCAEDGDAEASGVVEEWEDVCAAVG